jgi:AAA15 family ATPase/GTPase
MILEFSIKNFRSFHGKSTFSMVAETTKSKTEPIFEKKLGNGDTVRLLKSAVIYGPNASGKSNLLKAINILKKMVRNLSKAGEPIKFYDPFLFDKNSQNAPTHFSITFIGPGDYKYIYSIEYNKEEILEETLDYYLKSQKRNLFKRSNQKALNELIHLAKLGIDRGNREIKVFRNQTLLSKFGTDEPDEMLSSLYLYFTDELKVLGNSNLSNSRHLVEKKLDNSPSLMKKLNKLISVADTKIGEIILEKKEDDGDRLIIRGGELTLRRKQSYDAFAKHGLYENKKKIDDINLSFDEESKGTNVLYVLGTLVLETLEKGGVFLIDEIDTSLHPKLAKFIVLLFQHPVSNPHNAQIIFTTHETTFLDKDVFRKDQIWFVEKNEYGESELFSVQDFENVRETTPFEKWYLAGKFGGIPEIKELEFIFQNG